MIQEEFIKYLVDILIYPDEFKINEFDCQEFYKDNKLYFRYNQESDTLWCSYKHVWRVFKEKYGLKYEEFKELIKYMLKKYFKMEKTKAI